MAGLWDVPSYSQCFSDIYRSVKQYLHEKEDIAFTPKGFLGDLDKYGYLARTDIILVVVVATALTLVRWLLTSTIFSPMALWLKLTPTNREKFPEACFKLLCYICSWLFTCYLLIFSGKYNYFSKPLEIWTDWQPGLGVPVDIYLVYLTQFSFYLHSVYATLFMDVWRKDSLVMIFHHFLTMALIGFSFAVRYYKIGMLVLVLHDISDICLEFTKVNVYLKTRNNKYHAINDHISTVGFLCFAVTWFFSRLYLFPLTVLHSTSYGVMTYKPSIPFFLFFNVMLWVLLVLNVYWFTFIVALIVRVATGQMHEVDDIREHDVEEHTTKQTSDQQEDKPPPSTLANGKHEHHKENGIQANGASANTSNGFVPADPHHEKHE